MVVNRSTVTATASASAAAVPTLLRKPGTVSKVPTTLERQQDTERAVTLALKNAFEKTFSNFNWVVAAVPSSSSSAATSQMDQPQPQPQPQSQPLVQPTAPAFVWKNRAASELIMPSFALGPQKYEPVFTYLFKTTCRVFMQRKEQQPSGNQHCGNPDCRLEHRFPDHSYFRSKIEKMFRNSVIDLYENYMRRNEQLFDCYFEDFCHYFGTHGLLDNLMQMAEDCVARERQQSGFENIVDGLTLSGMPFAKAVTLLLKSMKSRSEATKATTITEATLTKFMDMILDPRIGDINRFARVIEGIRKRYFSIFTIARIHSLLIIHSRMTNVRVALNDTIAKIIAATPSSYLLDQGLYKKFTDAVRQSTNGAAGDANKGIQS